MINYFFLLTKHLSKLWQHVCLTRWYSCRNAINISYKAYGVEENHEACRGPPIFILHGLFGSKTNWHGLCGRIASSTQRKVFALDARNHGDSNQSPLMDYIGMSRDIVQLMDQLHLQRATLIGHSMGGKTAMATALLMVSGWMLATSKQMLTLVHVIDTGDIVVKSFECIHIYLHDVNSSEEMMCPHFGYLYNRPERVEYLIVVDITPSISYYADSVLRYSHFMKGIDLPTQSTPLFEARRLVGEQMAEMVQECQIRQFLLTNITKGKDGNYKWRVNLDAIIDNFESIAGFPEFRSPCYNVPTLFIGGSKSQHINAQSLLAIRSLFPNCSVRLVQGAGHWVHSEKPEQFLSVVIDFMLG